MPDTLDKTMNALKTAVEEKREPRKLTVRIYLAPGRHLDFGPGDVDFAIENGHLVVYNYGIRRRNPTLTGMIYACAPGQWERAMFILPEVPKSMTVEFAVEAEGSPIHLISETELYHRQLAATDRRSVYGAGWIEWKGGWDPFTNSEQAKIEVAYRGGPTWTGMSDALPVGSNWGDARPMQTNMDIVAYRFV